MKRYEALLLAAVVIAGGTWHDIRTDREQHAQTIALQQIAANTTQPIRNETTITSVDAGVCDTLGSALKADAKHRGKP